MNWEELKTFHLNAPVGILQRAPSVQQSYHEYLSSLKGDISSTLQDKLFPQDHPDAEYVLRPCDFPYELEKGITHMLLWCNPKFMIDPIQKAQQIFENKECVIFENNPDNRSVKKIRHSHIFLKS